MGRLDVRVKTEFSAKAYSIGKGEERRKNIIVKELSLSGALVQGLPDAGELFRIKMKLPTGSKVELDAEIVRVENGMTGLRLYYPDSFTMKKLWSSIRDDLSVHGICPYCGSTNSNGAGSCSACGYSLSFEDINYLKNHFKTTFLSRLESRVSKLDAEHLEKIINVIDREVLLSKGKPPEEEFVGTSPAMLEVFTMIRKVAPTDVNVLILGESGTGKELTARAIHERSPRREKPFIAVNSAAIPEGLLESELFGHEKGAFTGAYAARKGKFEQADGGTLFLDEIGDLPQGLQSKLLRFLEDRIVERVGGQGGKKVDVRIVTATNCDLEHMIEEGSFRQDLYFRLDGFTILLPPLRNRGEDNVILARFFLEKISRNENCPSRTFSDETLEVIRKYPWPGNVRELINKVRRGILMAQGSEICSADMGLQDAEIEMEECPMKRQVSKTQKEMIVKTLQDNNYVITRTAKALGISRPSLYSLMKKYSIARGNGKAHKGL